MIVLVIGYGSIGKRHVEVLSHFDIIKKIDIFTSQKIEKYTYGDVINKTPNYDIYDYIIIANETYKHYETLKNIVETVNNKKILVEKPLFDKIETLNILDNEIFVAYNLRFHPVIEYLKQLIKNNNILHVNIIVGQYLPTWRPKQNYENSYSASLKKGGGVLRDLSHEIDYVLYLFGDFKILYGLDTKISDLKIDADDICIFIAKTKNNTLVNATMDYISKIPIRNILIQCKDFTIKADLITGSIVKTDIDNQNEEYNYRIDRNLTYKKMHQAIIEGNTKNLCKYEEGLKIMKIIEQIKFKDLENV